MYTKEARIYNGRKIVPSIDNVESKSPLYTSVSLSLSCIQGQRERERVG